MTNLQPALWAALIGGGGSLAYFSTLFFGFVQGEEILAKLWPTGRTIRGLSRVLRIIWFILIGAAVAFTFQLPESTFAPIQAFIIGTTWPSIVAQILTGRQAEPRETIRGRIAGLLGE